MYDSHYERTLPPFIEQFGSRHCTILSPEDGKDNPSRMWNQLLETLNLSPTSFPADNAGPKNPTGEKAFRHLYRRLIPPIRRHLPGLSQWMLQSSMVGKVKRSLIQLLGTADEETIPEEVHNRLRHEFAPTYQDLNQLGFDHYPSP